MIEVKRGLDLPIAGAPEQRIETGRDVRHVAILGSDYVGMKPTMLVREGDKVALGQALFSDKKTDGVMYTAPASGEVVAINRGEKRRLLSVVIRKDQGIEPVQFTAYSDDQLVSLPREAAVEQLVASGLWTAFRTRPFSRVPALTSEPADIFVTAMDTHPLSADPSVVIDERAGAFKRGLRVLKRLTQGRVIVCKAPDGRTGEDEKDVSYASFGGRHPAGLPGTHIHFLSPVGLNRQVWHIGYQDVIAIGELFHNGVLNSERVIAIGGPRAEKPRLVRTCLGASFDELLQGEVIKPDDTRYT